MDIIIAMGTDENYMRQTFVVIKSVMGTASINHNYIFYILVADNVSSQSKKLFYSLEKKYTNCHISFIRIETQKLEVELHIKHITCATYFRLLLPELLKEDKCIYLDSDVIVCQDIAHLFETPMEGYEVAGVKAPSYHLLPEEGKDYKAQVGLASMEQYINAGVLLLNLSLMRHNQFMEKAMSLAGKYFPTQDQDIINLVSYGKIKFLPLKYNIPVFTMQWHMDRLEKVFSKEELEEGRKKPCILHYSDLYKPWDWLSVLSAEKWWDICRTTEFFPEFMREKQDVFYYYGIVCQNPLWNCEEYSTKWYDEVKKFPKVYVYGAGKVGEEITQKLQVNHVLITAVLVSKKKEEDEALLGVPVIEFSNEVDENALIILAVSSRYVMEIREMLFQNRYYKVFTFHNI